MGNNFCNGEQNLLEVTATKLLAMLMLADQTKSINGKFRPLLENHSDDLKSKISLGKYLRQAFGLFTVEIVPLPQQTSSQSSQQALLKNLKLVLKCDSQEESEQTFPENKQADETYEGCIVFSEGFYYGEVVGGKAHGKGTLYLPTHPQYEVSGTWQLDSLKKGDFYQIKQGENGLKRYKKCELELKNGEKEAILRVDGKFQYRGSIKLKGVSNLHEIMTGKGVVKYPNGDQYQGQLSNGLYHTTNQEGECKYSHGQYSRFKGHFKSGLRQGRGTLTMLVSGQLCDLSLEFVNGKPVGEAQLHFIYDNVHFPVEIQDYRPVMRKLQAIDS